MKKNSIIILSECGFTRYGLEVLLKPVYRVFSTSTPNSLVYLSEQKHATLVILSVSNRAVLASLVGAVQRIHRHLPHCKILLAPGAFSTPLLRFYFNYLHGGVGIIDLSQPLPALYQYIEQVTDGQVILSAEVIARKYRLSRRERSVLCMVMMGMKPANIAQTLQVNVKTVSQHKLRGLFKLGARNIQGFLSPSTPFLLAPGLNPFHDAAGILGVNNTPPARLLTAVV